MNRRILVTGGGKGVGAAIVRSLAAAGYDVDFTYRSSAEAAQTLAQELVDTNPGVSVNGFALDLSDKDAIEAFCERIESEGYYGFVHNAGQPYDALTAMQARGRKGRSDKAGQAFGRITISTRRFCALPSGVRLEATGWSSPRPIVWMRDGGTPAWISTLRVPF